ncbi:MAG: glycosyltransferase family 4 protein [Verrucomicrobiota bacterium]
MKILLLNQVFYPDVVATAQYLSDVAVELSARGHEVTVVSSRRAYEHPETIYPARETWRGVKIVRIFSTRFGKGAKWRRAADFASFLFFCCARLLFLPRQDVVLALTTPPLISFLGAWRAKLWRARFCYWVMDFNPDEAIAAGWLRADSFAAKWLERMSRFSLHRADGIIALDRFMRDRIAAKGIPSEKIAVIPPWSQDGDVRYDAAGREAFRKLHRLEGKFVVMYSGNHSPVHPLDTLMQAADQLRGESDLVFCFAGGGSEFQRIKKWAAERGRSEIGDQKSEILCLPYQPLDQLSASLSAADAHVVVMGSVMLGLVHPCKIYNMLTVGAPVIYIGPQTSHVTEILEGLQPQHPWVGVRHGAADELVRQIQLLRRSITGQERRPLTEVTARYSATTLLPQLVAVLEKNVAKSTG